MDGTLGFMGPELSEIMQVIDAQRHLLEQQFPIGSHVRVNEEPSALTTRMMQEYDMTRAEAIGTAQILREEKSEVLGILDMTDDSGQTHPFVNIMTSDGFMYAFRSEFIEKA